MCESCKSGGKPLAAVWWRVSSESQKDISPDAQKAECLALARQEGYEVPAEYVIGGIWGSLTVWDSPPMEKVKSLFRSRAIHALYLYDSDRGPGKPVHRMLFRALAEECGVLVRCKHGQAPDGETGELVEFLNAWAKEKQVLRAQRGAKDGTRARAEQKGLPVNGHAPYGFEYQYELKGDRKVPVSLNPRPTTYPVACRIWRMALAGTSMRGICRVLTAEGVPAPNGGAAWRGATLLGIVKNPAYCGKLSALRRERSTPIQRHGATHGKSTSVARPENEWVRLDFPVRNPIVSEPEWQQVQALLVRNQKESQVNRNAFYMLAGMVFCAGDGRRLRGSKGGIHQYYYRCTLGRGHGIGAEVCSLPKLNGARLEESVWGSVVAFLSDPAKFMAEMARRRGDTTSTGDDVRSALKVLEGKLNKVHDMETELALKNVRGDLSDEAYRRATAFMRAEAVHYRDEVERQLATLAAVERSEEAIVAMETLRDRMADKLQNATPQDKRWVLQCLGARVLVGVGAAVEVSVGADPGTISRDKYVGLRW